MQIEMYNSIAESDRNRERQQSAYFGQPLSFGPGYTEDEYGTEHAANDDDIDFIADTIAKAQQDLALKMSIPSQLINVSRMSNRTEIENSLQELSGEVKIQLGEFQRIVELSSFLVEQTRRFKEDLISYEQTISAKEGEVAELRERENCILEDWK
jgi:hypothetical protein